MGCWSELSLVEVVEGVGECGSRNADQCQTVYIQNVPLHVHYLHYLHYFTIKCKSRYEGMHLQMM